MKKTIVVLCAGLIAAGMSGCGGADPAEDVSQAASVPAVESQNQVDKDSPEGVIAAIQGDFDSTIADLEKVREEAYAAIGGTYEGYLENQQKLEDWYAYAEKQVAALGERTRDNGVLFFKSVVDTVDHENDRALSRALDDYYDAVYEDAFDKLYDAIYEDAFDDIYDTYYDGILLDAQDALGYSEVSKVRSDAYKSYERGRTAVYKELTRARSDVYQDKTDVSSGFYNKEFDIDAILGSSGASSNKSEGTAASTPEQEAEKVEPVASSASVEGVTPEFKEVMDGYEAFFDEFIAFMDKYENSGDSVALAADYASYMSKYAETMAAIGEIDEATLSEADALYLVEVSGRIATKTAGLL